jgi:phosphatidylinositol alpha 1,6-mannosyltransferase
VCILTTTSGDPVNTHLDGQHPNRSVLFLDNSVEIPFINDPTTPALSYHVGFSLSNKVKQEIEAFEPSIIHITCPDVTCLHLIQYARNKELPLMGTYHSNIPEYMEHYPGIGWVKFALGAFFRHEYNFLQHLYVPTPYIRQHLVESWNLHQVTELNIWGRGIDLERFSPEHRSLKWRRSLDIKDTTVVVCWVGRLVAEKRPDIFAHVVRELSARRVDFCAVVIGAGPGEEEILALPNTKFLGWLSGDALKVAYASSDVFLFPSAVETFGNVTLEAAASGLPLVVEAGCSGHLVNHGVNGFACSGADKQGWLMGTLALLQDPVMRKRFSEASRDHSLKFEKGVVVRKMLNNYSTVTDEFYCDYGGRHANRDRIFQKKEGSFLGGNHPRPFLLMLVEYFFMVLFQVLWYFAGGFARFQDFMASRMPPAPALGNTRKVEAKSASVKASRTHIQGQLAPMATLESPESILSANIATTTTTARIASAATPAKPSLFCWSCTVSHVLAKSITWMFVYQFRLESNIRNMFRICCSPTQWSAVLSTRKRKDSSLPTDSFSSADSEESLGLLQPVDFCHRVRRLPVPSV